VGSEMCIRDSLYIMGTGKLFKS